MKDIKALLMAFLVGGIFAVVGQVLAMIVWQIPALAGYETIIVLLCMGLIGSILFACGLWDKIGEVGGMGATLPLSGLVAAIAGIATGGALETQSLGKGAFIAIKEIVIKVIGLATVICMIIGAAVFFLDGGSFDLGAQAMAFSESTGGAVPPAVPAYAAVSEGAVGPWLTNILTVPGPALGVINILLAFLITGAISALCQLIVMKIKVSMPVFLTILLVLGACLTIVGAITPLINTAGGGFQILVIDAGQAIIQLFCFALAGGIPGVMPFLLILGLFVALTLFGIGAAAIRVSAIKKQGGGETIPAE